MSSEAFRLQAGDQPLGRQAKLTVVADARLPSLRPAFVKNVVDDHGLRLVFQEAGQDARVVAPDVNEALIAHERHRVVAKRTDEHACGRQRRGRSFAETLDRCDVG
jgi:hypothetical protein